MMKNTFFYSVEKQINTTYICIKKCILAYFSKFKMCSEIAQVIKYFIIIIENLKSCIA